MRLLETTTATDQSHQPRANLLVRACAIACMWTTSRPSSQRRGWISALKPLEHWRVAGKTLKRASIIPQHPQDPRGR